MSTRQYATERDDGSGEIAWETVDLIHYYDEIVDVDEDTGKHEFARELYEEHEEFQELYDSYVQLSQQLGKIIGVDRTEEDTVRLADGFEENESYIKVRDDKGRTFVYVDNGGSTVWNGESVNDETPADVLDEEFDR